MVIDKEKLNSDKIYSQLSGSQAADETYLIGDLAREFNVSLRTLRFYEDRGLIKPKRKGMTRLYSSRDRARFALILKGKRMGFTLTEIQAMVDAEEQVEAVGTVDLAMSLERIDEQIGYLVKQKEDIEKALIELNQRRRECIAAQNDEE